jgi:hypothetical protein
MNPKIIGLIILIQIIAMVYNFAITLSRKNLLGTRIMKLHRSKLSVWSAIISTILFNFMLVSISNNYYKSINTLIGPGVEVSKDLSIFYVTVMFIVFSILKIYGDDIKGSFIFEQGLTYKCKTVLWREVHSYRWEGKAIILKTNRRFWNRYLEVNIQNSDMERVGEILVDCIGKPVKKFGLRYLR